ncbi:MAG: MFS transporter [Acidobacteria bacterium]|nr:MFS transporter [Acidobacteriota bacterium]
MMQNSPDEARKPAIFALIVLFAINTLNFFDRQILAAVNEPIRIQWNLGDGAMGLISTAFTLIYAAVGLPLGRWADRGRRTSILSFGVAFWSIFTAASGMAWSYSSLFVARIGVGVGEASCSPAANSMIGDLFPPAQRARAISVFMLGLPVGIFLCYWLTGMIVEGATPYVGLENAWKVPFFFATIPGLILAVVALRLPEPMRGASEHVRAKSGLHRSPWRRLLTIPTLWWIIISGALHNFNAYAVNAFLPAYLGRYHGLGLRQANTISAIVLGAVGVVGLLGGGVIADLVRRKSERGRMLFGALCMLVLIPCLFQALRQPPGAILPFMLLTGFGWSFFFVYYVTVYPTIQDVVEPELRGTAMAIYFFAMYVLGGAFGTTVLGFLSDHYAQRAMHEAGAVVLSEAHRAMGLHDALLVVPFNAVILAIILFAGSLTVRRDIERLRG